MKKKRVTLEHVLTDPAFFGLTTATKVQRAICRVSEGLPLGDLANDPDVSTALGGPLALDALAWGSFRPRELDVIAGIRGGKSLFAAAHALWTALTCDLSTLRVGEVARYAILSVNLTSASATLSHLAGTMQDRPLLRKLLAEPPTADRVLIRRADGRIVEVVTAAGAKAGANLISVWLVGVVFEEYPRQAGDGAAVNYPDQLASAAGRVAEGGQILSVGSPWAPFGPAFERFSEFFGKPSGDRVVIKATGPMLNPAWWTPERCAALQRANPTAYVTDVLSGFADPSTSAIPQAYVKAATRATSAPYLPSHPGWSFVAAMDPGTRANAWTLVIVAGATLRTGETRFEVCVAREWQGSTVTPLDPAVVIREILATLRPYKLSHVFTDQHAADAYVALGAQLGLAVTARTVVSGNRRDDRAMPPGNVWRNDLYETMAAIFATAAIGMPADRTLIRDLLSVRRVVTRGGVTFDLPTTADGRHCDYAPALALALVEWNTHLELYAIPPDTRAAEAELLHNLTLKVGRSERGHQRAPDGVPPEYAENPYAGSAVLHDGPSGPLPSDSGGSFFPRMDRGFFE